LANVPRLLIKNLKAVEDESSLQHTFGVHVANPVFQVSQCLRSDWVIIPVKFVFTIVLGQREQTADQLGSGEVLVVFQIENDFIATHQLKV